MFVLIYFLLLEFLSWAIEFIDEAVKMGALAENSLSLNWWWLSLLEEKWPVTRAWSDPVRAEIARKSLKRQYIRQYNVCWASKYGFPTINIQFSLRCVGLVNVWCMSSLFPVLANAYTMMLIWLNRPVLHQLRTSWFVNVGYSWPPAARWKWQ